MGDKPKLKKGVYQNPNSERSKESIDRYVKGMRDKKYGGKKINTDRIRKFSKGMTPGQAKIAGKAPPPNKIDEKDFAVLRAEKGKSLPPGLGAAALIAKKKKDILGKRMGGSMMKKYSKGGGADSGKVGEMKSRLAVLSNKFKKNRDTDRLTQRDIEFLKEKMKPKGKMGGGMIGSMQTPMQRPMAMSGYKKGTMVKARGCKLGRTRPTKIT